MRVVKLPSRAASVSGFFMHRFLILLRCHPSDATIFM
jgi:hypothetical protein